MRRKWLTRYVVRRLLMVVPLVLLVTIVAFSLTYIAPGGPVATLLGGHPTTEEAIKAIEAKYHLNDPLPVQYLKWLKGVLTLDFGRSITTSEPVLGAIGDRLKVSVVLNFAAIFIAMTVGVTLGCLAALKRGGWIDQSIVATSVLGISSPAFVVGILLLYIFSLKLGWFPIYGAGSSAPLDRAHHLALPAITIAFGIMGLVMRITRAAMIQELSKDYTSFARARGVPERKVVMVYAFRNALVQVTTAAGLLIAGILGGSVLVETVYGLPGVGRLLVASVTSGDIPMLQGLVLLFALWVVLFYILLDVIYALLDPRIAYEKVAR